MDLATAMWPVLGHQPQLPLMLIEPQIRNATKVPASGLAFCFRRTTVITTVVLISHPICGRY